MSCNSLVSILKVSLLDGYDVFYRYNAILVLRSLSKSGDSAPTGRNAAFFNKELFL